MSYLQRFFNFINLTPIKCSQSSSQPQLQLQPQSSTQDQFQYGAAFDKKVCSFQQLHAPLHFVTQPQAIKGFKFQFMKLLSPQFQVYNTWQIPNSTLHEENQNQMMMMMMGHAPQKATYTFMGQLLLDIRNRQPHTILVGKLDTQKKLQAVLIKKINKDWTLKLSSSLQSPNIKQGLFSCDVIYNDKKTNSQIKLLQPYQQFSFTQKISNNLILSFDYTHLLAQKMSGWSFGLKSFFKNNILITNYLGLQQQFNIGYKMPIRKDITFGANYSYNPAQSVTSIGFQKKFAMKQISATINTKSQMTTSIALKTLVFLIKLGATADYKKQKYSFGYGISTFG